MPMDSLLAALRQPPALLLRLAAVPGLHLVGGWLRDAWYGQSSTDFDLIAEGDFEAAAAGVAQLLGQQAYLVNERFATTRFMLDGCSVDLQPMRPGGLTADLGQRDYTVNTLCLPLSRLGRIDTAEELHMADGTLADLEARTLRIVSAEAMAADPLRVLRGYRLAACEGLRPDVETRRCWHELRGRLLSSAAERIHEELLQWFDAPAADPDVPRWPSLALSLRWAAEDGVLWQLIPPLEAAIGCEQNIYHHLDVWNHTLECQLKLEQIRLKLPEPLQPWAGQLAAAWAAPVGAKASAGALTRLALLLHDVAKPPTRAVQADGKVTFYGHQELGAEMARELLARLRFSAEENEWVRVMVAEHLRLGFYAEHDPLGARLVYRYIRSHGAATPLALLHSLADCASAAGEGAQESWDKHLRAAVEVLEPFYSGHEAARPTVWLDGTAIMTLLGLPPGKQVGALKEALLEATAAGEVRSAEAAEGFVQATYKSMLAEAEAGSAGPPARG